MLLRRYPLTHHRTDWEQSSCNKQKWKPVAYASRSMTEMEMRYAQIEKEALAVTWSCENFSCYILGGHFDIETDHKPLVPLLSTKSLDNLSPCVLCFQLRLARYDYSIMHVPGKLLYTADTLSRAPLTKVDLLDLQEEVELFIGSVVDNVPASSDMMEAFKKAQSEDPECSRVKEYCLSSWPVKEKVEEDLISYWKVKSFLTLKDGLLLHGNRIVILTSLRQETLEKVHTGHQGRERCQSRNRCSVWWPGVIKQMGATIQQCPTGAKEATPRKEPLMASPLPDYPWQVIRTDLFELNGETYLLVVDYFSRYPEIARLTSTTPLAVINVLKSLFARHGISECVRSDNGPQYSSREFSHFAESYGFQHLTSSPRYPASNGQAERTVQTIKRTLKKDSDPYIALLNYRATPLLWCQRSSAELLMERRLRTCVSQVKEQLTPTWGYLEQFKKLNQKYKMKQKRDFDKHHRSQELDDLPENIKVWVTSEDRLDKGRVILIETPTGVVRRNRSHLNVVTQNLEDSETGPNDQPPDEAQPNRIVTRSQTGSSATVLPLIKAPL